MRVPHGVHKVSVEGQLQRRNSATLQFGIVPQHVVLKAEGWTVDGLSKTGSVGESLQIIRAGQETEKKEDALETQAEIPLPDWYVVTREITLGQPWVVSTTVRRLGAGERSQMMKLPLLAGESVTEESIKVESGNAQVVFPRGESIVTWNSTFREEPKFELKASSGNNLNEEWKLRCATIWRCSFEGLKPVHTMEGSEYVIDWKPWPGEKVDILVSKPLGVDGLTETIREAKLHWEPGSGLLRGTLSFTILSSQGGFRRITLPPGAMVQQVMNGGSATNLMPKGQILELPIHPGEEQFSISWQQPWDAGFASQLPLVDIGGEAFNVNVSSTIPGKRWLLAAKGPAWGPAVLFWGGLTIVLCFGLLVGKLGVPPLKTREWIFLGLGTATLHPTVLLVPVFWSLLVELRRRKPLQNAFWFNGAQGGLLLLSLFTLGVLFASLYCGLIIDPDMGVRGQGSSTRFLKWYVDRSASGLPTPTIYWSPMWIYRLFMLCWSTWLVFVVLRWLKWAWSSLGDGGWWKRGDTKE